MGRIDVHGRQRVVLKSLDAARIDFVKPGLDAHIIEGRAGIAVAYFTERSGAVGSRGDEGGQRRITEGRSIPHAQIHHVVKEGIYRSVSDERYGQVGASGRSAGSVADDGKDIGTRK